MAKKHTVRRTVSGVLAVLTVTGNLLAPSQMKLPLIENTIKAEAATISQSGRADNSGIEWDASTGTLTIKDGITNKDGAVDKDEPDRINSNSNGFYTSTGFFGNWVSFSKVKKIVIAKDAVLPRSWYHLFRNFTNLEAFVIEEGADATLVYDFGYAFSGLTKLKTVDMSGLKNVATIDYLEHMFSGCSSLETLYLPKLDGTNAGKRTWGNSSYVHPALDHVKGIIAGCNKLHDLDLTGEYLHNLFCTVAAEDHKNPDRMNENQINTLLDKMLTQMLDGLSNPPKREIYDILWERFWGYRHHIQSEHQWQPVSWNWNETDWTCTVTLKKLDGETKTWLEKTEDCIVESVITDDPGCTKTGKKQYIAKWTDTEVTPNASYSDKNNTVIDVDALGHAYENNGFDWHADYTADFVRTCSRCETVERIALNVAREEIAATCTENAKTVYIATYGDLSDEKVVIHENTALGHSFNEFLGFEWYDGDTKAKAKLGCERSNCNETTEVDANMTSQDFAATCTEDGYTMYYAEYNGNTDERKVMHGNTASGHTYGEPTWKWNKARTKATATFSCTNDNCNDSKSVSDDDIEVYVENGKVAYKASVLFNGREYTNISYKNATLTTASASLKEKIGLNFYVDIPEQLAEGSYVVLSHKDKNDNIKTYKINTTAELRNNEYNQYKYTIDLIAREIEDDVTIQLFDSNDQPLVLTTSNGTDYTGGFTYTLLRYLNAVTASENQSDEMKELARSTKDYCFAAKNHFDQTTYELRSNVDDVNSGLLTNKAHSSEGTLPENVALTELTVMVESDNSLRLYLDFANGADPKSFKYKVDGKNAAIQKRSDGHYYLAAKKIKATDLDLAHTFTIYTDTTSFTFTASVLSYVRLNLLNAENKETYPAEDTNLRLCKALYWYNKAADAVFQNNN